MPTLRGSELEQRDPEMEQSTGRHREKMKDLRTSSVKHRHTELSVLCAQSLLPILPGFGLEQGWWKAGTPPGHGAGDSANQALGHPADPASSAAADYLATVRPSKVMEATPRAAGVRNKASPFLRSVVSPTFVFPRT